MKEDMSMMTHTCNPSGTNAFGVAPVAPPITDRGIGRALVRMLAAAVERDDFAEALKVARGAESHFEWLVANPQAVVR